MADKEKFIGLLKEIIDPHTGINIVDMGLVRGVEAKADGVSVKFSPTSPYCPITHYFSQEIEKRAKQAGFETCSVEIV
jgi:metal-sulfur cluster biosynthetic enzyme